MDIKKDSGIVKETQDLSSDDLTAVSGGSIPRPLTRTGEFYDLESIKDKKEPGCSQNGRRPNRT